MESGKDYKKHKGVRPRKEVKRDEQLAVMCTLIERTIIEHKAKSVNLSVSEFLRTLALKGQVDCRKKSTSERSFARHCKRESHCSKRKSNSKKAKQF
jgi:hypothetical protein